jgi:glycosyltransferase involved in cell wall biosynthesis
MKGDRSRVSLENGWIEQQALRDEIRDADVVVLPFVLVPSELPVSIMECVACATPVITTDIDGLPEAIGGGGWVVRSADLRGLIKAMRECRDSADILKGRRKNCLKQRDLMKSWAAVAELWMDALG